MDDALERLAAALRAEMASEPEGPGRIALQEIHDAMLAEAHARVGRAATRKWDYRALLKRYMAYVSNRAGHTYLSAMQIEAAHGLELLDSHEARELVALAKEIGRE